MTRTLWICAIAVALLSLTCFAFASPVTISGGYTFYSSGTNPGTGGLVGATTLPVTVTVDAMAGVWFNSGVSLTVITGGRNTWVENDMMMSGNIASNVNVSMTDNKLPAGLAFSVYPTTDVQLAALKAVSILDVASNDYIYNVGPTDPVYTGLYVAPHGIRNSWDSTSPNETALHATGVSFPDDSTGGVQKAQMIYALQPVVGPPVSGPVTTTLTYTVTAQ